MTDNAMSEEMVTAVARAIHESESHLPWEVTCFQDTAYLRAHAAIRAAAPYFLDMAAEVAEREKLAAPQDATDIAYDIAVDHCTDAIRNLKEGFGK
ncbi:MAG: hypothetical protein WCY11_05130 [Novosphingobium sp.]